MEEECKELVRDPLSLCSLIPVYTQSALTEPSREVALGNARAFATQPNSASYWPPSSGALALWPFSQVSGT